MAVDPALSSGTKRVKEYIPYVWVDKAGQLCGCGLCSKPRYKHRGSQSTVHPPHFGMDQVGRLCGCGPCSKPRYKQRGSQSTCPSLLWTRWADIAAVDPAPNPGTNGEGHRVNLPCWDGPGGPTLRLRTLLQAQVQTERVTEYIPHVGMDQVGRLCGCGPCSKPRYK